MNNIFELQLLQTQKLIMTPELRQAIQILQYSNLELIDFIAKEINENPILDNNALQEMEHIRLKKMKHLKESEQYEKSFNKFSASNEDEGFLPEEYHQDEGVTLKSYLMEQLLLSEYDSAQHDLMEYLIQNINESGYLCVDPNFICHRFSVSKQAFQKALHGIQAFEPKGVGARSLKECLRLQIEPSEPMKDFLIQLIENHLEHIAQEKYEIISRALNLNLDQVKQLIQKIKSLNPKPGSGFGLKRMENTAYIVPELALSHLDETLNVTFIHEYVPHIRFNGYYLKLLEDKNTDASTREYLSKYLRRAEYIIKCIEQRKQTILSVANKIVEKQAPFFSRQPANLMPLTLKDIASDLDIHESTVSRAIDGKYLQTAFGVVSLKSLLKKPVSPCGHYTSADCMDEIKAIVGSEDKLHPFSDLTISRMMQKKGLDISRRTVAKYRESLDILSSAKRKMRGHS